MLNVLPNILTICRGLAGPLILLLVHPFDLHTAAFWVFIGAILTDLIDGTVARALGATSTLGQTLDPIADKVLGNFTWVTIGLAGWAPPWLVILVLIRDLAVIVGFVFNGLRMESPNIPGRLMVSVEGVALPVLLFRHDWMFTDWPSVGVILGTISLTLGVASAAAYGWQVWEKRQRVLHA